jgi:hypothetical protein
MVVFQETARNIPSHTFVLSTQERGDITKDIQSISREQSRHVRYNSIEVHSTLDIELSTKWIHFPKMLS